MKNVIELRNIERIEYCTLIVGAGTTNYYNGNKRTPGFTGHYFKDENTFFALYPTESGPKIFYEGKEYDINRELNIILKKDGKSRKFKINDYDIEINYTESPYIGFDVWSDEMDVDIFYKIEQSYKTDNFYERYTLQNK